MRIRGLLPVLAIGVMPWFLPVVGRSTDEPVRLKVTVPDEWRRMAGGGKRGAAKGAMIAYATPPGFDPGRVWPILIVSATSDPGYNSSVAHLEDFLPASRSAGWVLLAADPLVAAPPPLDTNERRYAHARAALEHLRSIWPGSEKWPIALGGYSGGAKRSGWLAALFARDGRMPIGIFQGGCNAATVVESVNIYSPPRGPFRSVPVYLSSGEADGISTPGHHRQVATALHADGFGHVRLAHHAGGHRLHLPHVEEALAWFATQGQEKARPANRAR
jgi:hypothetical protein